MLTILAESLKMKVNEKVLNKKIQEWTEEEKRNVLGVFEFLLKVDKRINPDKYKKQNDTTSRVQR